MVGNPAADQTPLEIGKRGNREPLLAEFRAANQVRIETTRLPDELG